MNPETLFDAIFAAQRDSQTAALYERREITYAELRAETIRAAEVFNALSLQPGERIAILLNDSPEFIASFIAIQSLGAIAVPINMALNPADQRLILNDCGSRSAIIEADTCQTLLTNASDSLRRLDRVLVVNREADFQMSRIEGVACELFAEVPRKALGPDFPAQSLSDASFILYT